MNIEVKHDKQTKRFYIATKEKCELKYRIIDKNTLEYYSTFVPEELRNKGLAGKIAREALEYAKSNRLQIVPTCSFVRSYIEQHPQYKNFVKK